MMLPAIDPGTRLALLEAFLFIGFVFLILVIIMRSLGLMAHSLNHFEDVLSKEVVLRYNRGVADLKQQKQRTLADKDKERRQEALLQIPLARVRPGQAPKGTK